MKNQLILIKVSVQIHKLVFSNYSIKEALSISEKDKYICVRHHYLYFNCHYEQHISSSCIQMEMEWLLCSFKALLKNSVAEPVLQYMYVGKIYHHNNFLILN